MDKIAADLGFISLDQSLSNRTCTSRYRRPIIVKLLTGRMHRLGAMAAEAAMPGETMSAEASEAMSSMLREIVVIVSMTKVPVMVEAPVMVEVPVMTEVIEAAKAETK